MKIGIIPNITKPKIFDLVKLLIKKLEDNNFEFFIGTTAIGKNEDKLKSIPSIKFVQDSELYSSCDIVLSIGGDGTMLQTAYEARHFKTPLLGVNFGKLGFLAEFDINNMDQFISDIKSKHYVIEERMALEAFCKNGEMGELFAINDVVIDKGRWPKMIEMTMKIDEEYVSTFSADGLIIATPTGSTGYSLSTGGPIITPKTDAIVISPISPHTLTMRPLVISSKQTIEITVESAYNSIQVNCDGQRVYDFKSPAVIKIKKSENPVRLVHTKSSEYFEILRSKLFWGLDVRKSNNNSKEIE
ncbi:MAG: NAD(+)/NADH kinase [Melioribacteraceae bacterium]|nr:NAD(+)/NADH kinase [Melioribacteraceae bacterium]MDD3559206.1 NAD(+)/NADH kinase [Melioribacteraceae bacterium]